MVIYNMKIFVLQQESWFDSAVLCRAYVTHQTSLKEENNKRQDTTREKMP